MSEQAGQNNEELNEEVNEKPEEKGAEQPVKAHHEHRAEHEHAEIKALKDEVERLKQENAGLDDSYRRKVADFDNYRKRMIKQMEDTAAESTRKFLIELLPIIDNFGRALKSTEKSRDFDQLYNGLCVTNKGILHFFDHIGVKPMDSLGKEFDPNFHEAVLMEEKEDIPFDKTVVEELEKGYLLGDSVIRHSKVKVAKKKQS
jgi:molecular chaperone GrpE